MTTDIKPDTSLYPNDLPSRFRALALIAEGHARGKTIQLNGSGGSAGSWEDTGDPQWLRGIEYRLKPEPRVVWVNFYENAWGFPFASSVYTSEQAARAQEPCEQKRIATAVRVELPE